MKINKVNIRYLMVSVLIVLLFIIVFMLYVLTSPNKNTTSQQQTPVSVKEEPIVPAVTNDDVQHVKYTDVSEVLSLGDLELYEVTVDGTKYILEKTPEGERLIDYDEFYGADKEETGDE